MKPNIFTIATKELSQDGFFTWLLQWADSKNVRYDKELNAAAQDLVRHLISQQFPIEDLRITTVETWRQWNHIDILSEVNGDFVIVIEDKINTAEHSKQLERYKEIATEHYKDNNKKLVFIYLKTGNESSATLKGVVEKGFAVIDRKAVLNIFNQRRIDNHIFIEFKEHLTEIENQTNSFGMLENITSWWKAAEGFFMALQDKLQDGDWRYVPNQTGGFLGFWYYWTGTEDYSLYIQIENVFENGIKLVIKIGDWQPDTSTLYYILEHLQSIASNHGLTLAKPYRYRTGETSTLAIVDNAFPIDSEGKFDLDKFVTTLHALERTLDNFCDQENDKQDHQQGTAANKTNE
jgi:hypothetical protein